MIVGFFRTNNLLALFTLPVIAVLLWISAFNEGPGEITSESLFPLYGKIAAWLTQYKFVGALLSVTLILLEAFLLNKLIEKYRLLPQLTYLPALLYVVLMSSFPGLLTFHHAIIVNLLLILAVDKVMAASRSEKIAAEVFDAGLLISLASTLYFPALIFSLLVWLGLTMFRSFAWREYAIALIGMLIPYLYVMVYFFWNDQLDVIFQQTVMRGIQDAGLWNDRGFSIYLLLGVMLLIFVIGIPSFLQNMNSNIVRVKKRLLLLTWFFLLSCGVMIVDSRITVSLFAFAAIPLSTFFANYFLVARKPWFREFVFYLMLAAIVYNQIAGDG